MNNKLMQTILQIVVTIAMLGTIVFAVQQRQTTSTKAKPATNTTVIANSQASSKSSSSQNSHSTQNRLTDADVVGVWINHHNKNIHQQITFTSDHRWKENQHHVTNIYSGTWKITSDNQISLAPYGEKIRLYGHNFNTMDVLNYHHILNKQLN